MNFRAFMERSEATSVIATTRDFTDCHRKVVERTAVVADDLRTTTIAIEHLMQRRAALYNTRYRRMDASSLRMQFALEDSAIAELRSITFNVRALAYSRAREDDQLLEIYERLYQWVRRLEGPVTGAPCPVCRRNIDRDDNGIVLPHADTIGTACVMSGKPYGT